MGYNAFNPRAMSALGNFRKYHGIAPFKSQFLTSSSAQRALINAIIPP
jgi:hypothetical protein